MGANRSASEVRKLAEAPLNFGKGSRACLYCRLVQTYEQFIDNGCGNCVTLNMKGDKDRVSELTTSNYSGMVSLLDGRASWVGKWLRLGTCAEC